ncbi:MAG: hypothetical protein GWP91_23580 [Rhodobacterales bacterium]|nr:hypothetical protein [Rhodobacterales bacterium]
MIALLLWLACARPTPPALPPPPPSPSPAISAVDGWFLLQRHESWLYVDLLGPDGQALATEAVSQGQGPQLDLTGPPDDADPETTRRFLAAFQGSQRPKVFSWPTEEGYGPMLAQSLRVVSAVPTLDIDENLVLRVWLAPLDDAPLPSQALTQWRALSVPLLGGQQRAKVPPTCSNLGARPVRVPLPAEATGSPMLCTALPLPGGDAWVATEQMYGADGLWTGSCTSSELRRSTGGVMPTHRACRSVPSPVADHTLLYGISALDSGPNLPVAWFSRGPQRWWVVNHTLEGTRYRCLAAEPGPAMNFDLSACAQPR